ncbi:hypothetical protein KSP40_PGU020735 [Platanthera guangdongensis]|uniref:MHC class I antigen n=1 Tax=Platanthera guangdongensis TaxID=2320717 RepID=A0ABR2M228_9ASPA
MAAGSLFFVGKDCRGPDLERFFSDGKADRKRREAAVLAGVGRYLEEDLRFLAWEKA